MAECAEMARRLGQRCETLEIPVYLYEEAATSPSGSILRIFAEDI